MGRVTHKERVLAAINHEYADRVPIDYSAVPEVTDRLMQYFKLNNYDELLEKLNVDFRIVEPRFLDAKHVEDFEDGSFMDIWGVKHKIIVSGNVRFHEFVNIPLSDVNSINEAESYPWPTADMIDVSMLKAQTEMYKDYAIVSGPWTPLLCQLFFMRGYEQTLIDMVTQPDLTKAIVRKIVDFYFDAAVRIFEEGKGKIDIFFTGDDFASQNGLIISRDMFCEFFKPGLRRLFGLAKDYNLKVMLHSCGSVVDIIPDFIEIGVDIINPVQVRAKDMDIEYLKESFGDRVTFHGAIDQQNLLPFGTEEQVRESVRNTINILGRNGGYILCSSHDLLDDIPTSNILAMYEEAYNYRRLQQL